MDSTCAVITRVSVKYIPRIKKKHQKPQGKFYRKNDQIRLPQIRVIDEKGEQLGVISNTEALSLARERGLDLVEVSPKADPPVCRIIDFGKMQYEKEKEDRKQKVKQKIGQMKGIRLTANIGEHDFATRTKQAEKFLDKGYKINLELRLKGREKAHPRVGEDVMKKFINQLGEEIKTEQAIKKQGGRFTAIITKD